MSERLISELAKQQKRFEDWLTKHDLSDSNPIIDPNQVDLPLLLSMCYDGQKAPLCLHAIWYLEKYVKVHRQHLNTVIPSLVSHLNNLAHEGAERIAGNILLENFKKPVIYTLLSDENETIIETCFNWMISTNKPVAIVANGIEILYHLVDKEEWIRDELLAQINMLENKCSAALNARGRKITQKLIKTYTSTQDR